jgi:hypothetical protein
MASRLELHDELCELLGSRCVYFQPPESIKLNYPCIVYSRSNINKLNANNALYKKTNQYEVIVIDRDPDSDISDRILEHFSMCRFDREYTSDNLNHNILTLYY